MEEQDQDQVNSSSEHNPSNSEAPPFMDSDKDTTQAPLSQPPIKSTKNRRTIFLLIAIVFIVVGGLFVWRMVASHNDGTTSNSAQSSGNAASSDDSASSKPFAMVYAVDTFDESAGQAGDCQTSTTKFTLRSLTDDSSTAKSPVVRNASVSFGGMHKNKVFIVTEPTCAGNESTAATVWYSDDSGSTYKQVLAAAPAASAGSMYDQVTSALFSNDGTSLLVAYLPSEGNENIVKEIDLSSGAVKDLFHVDEMGVFLRGYDKTAHKVYYFKGCYNCGGNPFNEMLAYNTSTEANETIFKDPAHSYGATVFSADQTKILLVKSDITVDYPESNGQYQIEQFNLADKTSKQLITVDKDYISALGFTENGGIYYGDASKVYALNPDGSSSSVLYESSQPIMNVYMVSKDQVILSAGEYDNYKVIRYNYSTKDLTSLLDGGNSTRLIGVSWR